MTNPGLIILYGYPLYLYLGIATFIALIGTLTIGFLIYTGRADISIRWHLTAAATTIILAIIHVSLVYSAYFLR
jgi:ABC-type proline/glycine betaine transport system permease subunit